MYINQSFHKNIGKTITNENSTLSSIDSNFDTNYIEKSNTFISLVDTNNVNDLLKNLANKELQLLESKRNIEELKRKLLYYEKLYDQQYSDLKKLKAEVSRHISDKSMMNVNISNDSTKKESQAGDEIIQSTPEKHFQVIKKQSSDVNINKVEPSTSPLMIRKRNNIDINFQRDTTRRNLSDMSKESHIAVTEFNPIDYNPPKKPQSKYESMWSKPFAFFNQFDQLLQSELEKSLNWDNETENDSSFIEETDKEEPNEVVRSEITAKNTGHKPNSNDCLCNKSVNDKRKRETKKFNTQLANMPDDNNTVFIWNIPKITAGIVGIIAGKAVERFNKPSIIVTSKGNGMLHGSARSAQGINLMPIMEILHKEGLVSEYGGHAEAVGIHFEEKNIQAIQDRLNELIVFEVKDEEEFPDLFSTEDTLEIDEFLTLDNLNVVMLALSNLLPVDGRQLREAVFAITDCEIKSFKTYPSGYMELTLKQGNTTLDMSAMGYAQKFSTEILPVLDSKGSMTVNIAGSISKHFKTRKYVLNIVDIVA